MYEVNARNKVKRIPKRGHYDRETIFPIIDAAFVCHVGFSIDNQPYVIPTAFGRDGDKIYLHGATKSRMLMAIEKGLNVCITITHVDGLVLARSTFHHSMNYRSAVLFGKARKVEGAEKYKALEIVTEQILKGRWDESRKPNAKELKATTVLCVEIEQASAKIRTGGPGDEKEDYALPIWAGVVPMQVTYGDAIPDPLMETPIPVAGSVQEIFKDV